MLERQQIERFWEDGYYSNHYQKLDQGKSMLSAHRSLLNPADHNSFRP